MKPAFSCAATITLIDNPYIHSYFINQHMKCIGVAMASIIQTSALEAFPLSVYPSSQPVFLELLNHRVIESLTIAGASIRSAFCGPCFGAGDVPANNALSIRHTTRNFPNREGSKPVEGQISSVALMDARSIAATAKNGGFLTSATDVEFDQHIPAYHFNQQVYTNRVYQGFGQANPSEELIFGPNIAPWPTLRALPNNLLLKVAAVIQDAITTTDELIPSGETSSFRSNPLRLAEFTLSRKEPQYVGRAKQIQELEQRRQQLLAEGSSLDSLLEVFAPIITDSTDADKIISETGLGSVIFAIKPGDGSAREQAASCQRVLGGDANIAVEYATKRYRSNLINWGMIPFTIQEDDREKFAPNDCLFIPNIRQAIESGALLVEAYLIKAEKKTPIQLKLEHLSEQERDIILAGCLINYYAHENARQ
ncbi:hypothetical protein HA075_24470 [bacterium BFN5]|nr:hypothetical protein HA075_24470 [bacterium BFN5]